MNKIDKIKNVALEIRNRKLDKDNMLKKYPKFVLKTISLDFESYNMLNESGTITVTFDTKGKLYSMNCSIH